MVQLTYYPTQGDVAEKAVWTTAPDDVHTLRHGYNLADIHRLTRMAVWRIWGLHLDYQTRYSLAWSGIVTHLYTAPDDQAPAPGDLVFAGQDAIGSHVRDDMRHRGRGKHKDGEIMNGFAAYWELPIRNASSPEPAVVDRTALWQIWPELSDTHRGALLALAAHGTYEAAAASLGITPKTFRGHIGNARRAFLVLWHEHEEPSRIWGADRRVGRAGGDKIEATYRAAAQGIRRGRAARPSKKKIAEELEHGKASTYSNHKCRCDPCVAAKSAESAARRARAGVAERKQMTVTQFADAVRRNEAGETWTSIAASIGFSESYLRALRRGAASPVPDAAPVVEVSP